MDLRLYGKILWRFRYVVLAGWLLATLLAFFSVVKIGSDGVSYRQRETFVAAEDLFVNQRGFPWGRSFVPEIDTADPGAAAALAGQVGDPNRLAALAEIYVQLAQGDQVRDLMLQSGPVDGEILAEQFTADNGRRGLPLLRLSATAESPVVAIRLVKRQAEAFRQYLVEQQEKAGIPPSERVVLTLVRGAKDAKVDEPRSFTRAIVVFLGVLIATVGLAFILENVWPRSRARMRGRTRFDEGMATGYMPEGPLLPGEEDLEIYEGPKRPAQRRT